MFHGNRKKWCLTSLYTTTVVRVFMVITFYRLHRRRSLLHLFLRSVFDVKTSRRCTVFSFANQFFAKEREIFWRRLNKHTRYSKEKVEEKILLRKWIIFIFNRYTNRWRIRIVIDSICKTPSSLMMNILVKPFDRNILGNSAIIK